LEEVLANECPTLANLVLSLHVDRIVSHKDGRVVMRTCKLGSFPGALDLFIDHDQVAEQHSPEEWSSGYRPKARRRGRVRLDFGKDVDIDLEAAANMATDPDRFVDLPDKWFWKDTFQIPQRTWPFQEMAIEVATQRLRGKTQEELAESFRVTVPTIRKALRHAAEVDERFKVLPKKMPRARWHEEHAQEVATKKAEGLGTNALVEFFGKSAPTILKALDHAAQLHEQSNSCEVDE
jgi:hypothetical protein